MAEEYLIAACQQYTEGMVKKQRCTLERLYFLSFHPIYFYRYLCYNVPKAIAELVFEEEFFNGS